jgi:phosphoribosylformimino-5-aminoimidazole carboxamide ribotide isomerase
MILPVLDLMQGQIVRGIAGRRDEYRPIISKLIDTAAPIAVARAFRTRFGFDEFYLADLDAIQNGQPAFEVYDRLQREGFRLWIDAGIRTHQDDALAALLESAAAGIIVGLESVAGPAELQQIVERVGMQRTVFSLDLKAGRPLGRAELWHTDDPWTIAEHAVEALGVRRLIVLDLARVGVGAGVGTEELCMRLKRAHPGVEITAGGGVRGLDDVRRLHANGVDCVLVASALHDGRITPEEARQVQAEA